MHREISNEYEIVEIQPQIRVCLEDFSVEERIKLKWVIISIMCLVTYGFKWLNTDSNSELFCILNNISGTLYSDICVMVQSLSPPLRLNFMRIIVYIKSKFLPKANTDVFYSKDRPLTADS